MSVARSVMMRAWALLAAALWAGGCAAHSATMLDVRDALSRYELEEARAHLAEAGGGTDDLLFALEDGLILHYAGDYEGSLARFSYVEHQVDDLYTKSITREALSLVTSDLALRFEPRGIEPFLVNYYSALGYDALGRLEDAKVEWRKLAFKLRFARSEGEATYLDPPFFNYLVGLALEADDPNTAYISFRHAEAGYRRAGIPIPDELAGDLVRLARTLGFADHLADYLDRYGAQLSGHGLSRANGPVSRTHDAGSGFGEIIVLIEDGFVAPVVEARAYVPILEDRVDATHGDDRARFALARTLAREYRSGKHRKVRPKHAKKAEIAYVLPLALPVFGQGLPAISGVEMAAGDRRVGGRVVLDVSELQRQAFEDNLTGIYAKAILRAIVKFVAAEKLADEAEEKYGDKGGEAVGFLANVLNVATERADTRSWLALPHRVWMIRARVPAGRHPLSLAIDRGERVDLGVIDVAPGERRVINHRFF